mmetsp:Transcript_3834/g.9250  ORF Transcript_3834/g.9250 Transcript_3834/m.9250 type:complete len:219 (-) Transcript_3834:747-1403(-)
MPDDPPRRHLLGISVTTAAAVRGKATVCRLFAAVAKERWHGQPNEHHKDCRNHGGQVPRACEPCILNEERCLPGQYPARPRSDRRFRVLVLRLLGGYTHVLGAVFAILGDNHIDAVAVRSPTGATLQRPRAHQRWSRVNTFSFPLLFHIREGSRRLQLLRAVRVPGLRMPRTCNASNGERRKQDLQMHRVHVFDMVVSDHMDRFADTSHNRCIEECCR